MPLAVVERLNVWDVFIESEKEEHFKEKKQSISTKSDPRINVKKFSIVKKEETDEMKKKKYSVSEKEDFDGMKKRKHSTREKEHSEDSESQAARYKKITLDDLEESIRKKIKQKLDEDDEVDMTEEDKEFKNLNSYLLGASARVRRYTAEALGYRIFKKYMRQDIPGIGPYIETEQVEKVVDFMDFWAHKQQRMIMPRNIRHWMCPPLDKIPTNQP